VNHGDLQHAASATPWQGSGGADHAVSNVQSVGNAHGIGNAQRVSKVQGFINVRR
jgi:hypothetical protein